MSSLSKPAAFRGVEGLDARYRVLRQIGVGGMGRILLAHDSKLDREVAIKVIREDFAEEKQYVERFWREARAAAAIGHPNIVQVHEVGETTLGLPYLVMEALDGRDLRHELRAHGPLSLDRAIDISGQVLFALSAAHAAGIVHRDLKPGNIFLAHKKVASFSDLEASGGHEQPTVTVKLLDFGISRFLRFASKGRDLTGTGSILGTIQYMAPEQLDDAGEVDGRADLYAVGVILYEAVTGVCPFGGDDFQAVMNRALGQHVQPVHEVAPGLPEELSAVLERALVVDPDGRYQDAIEFIGGLRPLAHGAAETPPRRSPAQHESSTEAGLAAADEQESTWLLVQGGERDDTVLSGTIAEATTAIVEGEPTQVTLFDGEPTHVTGAVSFGGEETEDESVRMDEADPSDDAPTEVRAVSQTPVKHGESRPTSTMDGAELVGDSARGNHEAGRGHSVWSLVALPVGLIVVAAVAAWIWWPSQSQPDTGERSHWTGAVTHIADGSSGEPEEEAIESAIASLDADDLPLEEDAGADLDDAALATDSIISIPEQRVEVPVEGDEALRRARECAARGDAACCIQSLREASPSAEVRRLAVECRRALRRSRGRAGASPGDAGEASTVEAAAPTADPDPVEQGGSPATAPATAPDTPLARDAPW